jgi:hypothetical protein
MVGRGRESIVDLLPKKSDEISKQGVPYPHNLLATPATNGNAVQRYYKISGLPLSHRETSGLNSSGETAEASKRGDPNPHDSSPTVPSPDSNAVSQSGKKHEFSLKHGEVPKSVFFNEVTRFSKRRSPNSPESFPDDGTILQSREIGVARTMGYRPFGENSAPIRICFKNLIGQSPVLMSLPREKFPFFCSSCKNSSEAIAKLRPGRLAIAIIPKVGTNDDFSGEKFQTTEDLEGQVEYTLGGKKVKLSNLCAQRKMIGIGVTFTIGDREFPGQVYLLKEVYFRCGGNPEGSKILSTGPEIWKCDGRRAGNKRQLEISFTDERAPLSLNFEDLVGHGSLWVTIRGSDGKREEALAIIPKSQNEAVTIDERFERINGVDGQERCILGGEEIEFRTIQIENESNQIKHAAYFRVGEKELSGYVILSKIVKSAKEEMVALCFGCANEYEVTRVYQQDGTCRPSVERLVSFPFSTISTDENFGKFSSKNFFE